MLDWLSRATLRVIAQAGFDYTLDTLNKQEAPLVKAMEVLTAPTSSILAVQLLGNAIPFFQHLPLASNRLLKSCRDTIAIESSRIIEKRMQLAGTGELVEKKDLMSLLYKANMQTAQKRDMMSDAEMSAQIATFVSRAITAPEYGPEWSQSFWQAMRHPVPVLAG